MPLPPLSHHEILTLVAPFTRAGRSVDLAASDRPARVLHFRAVERHGAGEAVWRETLELACPEPDHRVLTRVLTGADGLQARLVAEGPDAGALLARIEAIDPARQWHHGAGHALAFSHRLPPTGTRHDEPLLTHAEARADGLVLRLKMSGVTGFPAELKLSPPADRVPDLPDDLLAVLGRDWDCLSRDSSGWRGTYAARGEEPARSRRAEAALVAAASHLGRTLAEPPAQYHERLAGARWRVVLRRSLPLLSITALVAASAAVPSLGLAQDSTWRMLIFNAPPILVAVGICLRELPRFELPTWPRRSPAAGWWREAAPARPPLAARTDIT
jgi:hypothetical protein